MSRTKLISSFGHLSFAILLVMSIVYAIERNLYIDSAYYFFNLVNNGSFDIQHLRYSSFITQLLPLVFIKFGASLQLVMYMFSISFVLLFYGIWLIINFVLKSPYIGISLILVLILPVRENFFKPVTELHQALAWSLLLLAWLNYNIKKDIKQKYFNWKIILLSFVLILLCYFSHPISLFTILFVLAWIIIDNNKWTDWQLYILILFTLVMFTYKLFIEEANQYEGERLSNAKDILRLLPEISTFYSWRWFMNSFNKLFFIPTILLIIYLLYASTRKQFSKAGLTLLSVFGFFFISIIAFKNGDGNIMMEKNFMPLSFFIIIPFSYEVLKSDKINKITLISVVFFIVLFSSYRIIRTGRTYVNRVNYIKQIVQTAQDNHVRKAIIQNTKVDANIIQSNWGVPLETLLISSLDGPDNSVSVYIYNDSLRISNALITPDRFLFVSWYLNRNISILNEKYFILPSKEYSELEENISYNPNWNRPY